MRCSLCGKGEVVAGTRDVPFTYKGQKTFIKNIRGEYCNRCGEGYYGPEHDGDILMAGYREFREKVDTVLAEQATFVEQVRKKLGLDQREAGEIFGGGVNAFSRYETGKVRTPVSVMQLFTLLDRHPELLEEIRQNRYRTRGTQELREEVSAQKELTD
ncbi:transcriptional regulator, XRE family [Nitrosospira multiformis ATCC 25196]|uniref:Transcriptional regulator, XRE family n=1 Tax=Nitrosospira multiformis (strain ATCC 25196 / NCIMB 11849 / C 71) TaxID=323848 RepID=Q2Y6W9_NITMU|nr:type II toxin-antitoxin system MqsA family antitoxin [Nitrosospira multiformis]ABB75502.1 transcriptional regulator, XRE family [Nitrosospira multiformis ATCC 25196]SEF70968.1 transcriptional regulator, XRE family [Nitrosospira multiformis ATCC 25196]